jgi:arsenate reductase
VPLWVGLFATIFFSCLKKGFELLSLSQIQDIKCFKKLSIIYSRFQLKNISAERKEVLQPLVGYIQTKKENTDTIRLNFICTHNSRRSHLSQIWAQAMAFHFGIKNIFCYSGGTEATAMFPKVVQKH